MSDKTVEIHVFEFRHLRHKANAVPVDELLRGTAIGCNFLTWLTEQGVPEPVLEDDSSAPRAVQTGAAIRMGGNFNPAMGVQSSPALGDMTLGRRPITPDEVAIIQAYAAEQGCTLELAICECPALAEVIKNRAEEAAQHLESTLRKVSKTLDSVTVCSVMGVSHGGRIEPMVETLCEGRIDKPAFMLAEGQCAHLVFRVKNDQDVLCTRAELLDFLA